MRRVDLALAKPEIRRSGPTSESNGLGSAIETFLSSLDLESDAAAYFAEHRHRIIRSLTMVPAGTPQSRALELGSYMQMAPALERVLGYGSVRASYYSPTVGREKKMFSIAGQPYQAEVDLFDAESHTFPYRDSAFELVLCCELIEHLTRDPMHMLCECWRVLADGGQLIVTTPNVASITSVATALEGKHNPQVFSRYPAPGNPDTPHIREYTPHEIGEMVSSAGFEITALFTERPPNANHSTWVLDILASNGFSTELRGEQMYCVASKSSRPARNRFPEFLYSK